ncbi:hypothetical protein HQ447_05545 [bacterium]|nr:hypothetical protein [bacterium]
MKAYEIEVTATKMICVAADNEEDALEIAREEGVPLGWDEKELRIEDDYDSENPKEAKFIDDYRYAGEFYEA